MTSNIPPQTIGRPRSNLSLLAIGRAIQRLTRRIADLDALLASNNDDRGDELKHEALRLKIDETLIDIFGPRSLEEWKYAPSASSWHHHPGVAIPRTRARLQALVEALEERAENLNHDASAQAQSAFAGLALHPDIERAAGQLYRDGHYANAVEDACKALNLLVKLRSGRDDLDGKGLMTTVFSKNTPILQFNDLGDQSDLDEQEGMMHLFAGTMMGFRNPRAHKFIEDDPERALECIAFVSLLAKLLDGAQRG